MSRIFLSHCSADEIEALALRQWLTDKGWDDVFLDIDAERGLVAGERWQEALRRAADRCEAVVFLVSPAWAASKWCLAEFLLAKSLHKLIFGAVIEEIPIGELPTEMTSEWQLCHLIGDGSTELIPVTRGERSTRVEFSSDGLKRLSFGLKSAGLAADFFPWPPAGEPERSPYRGLEVHERRDAAIFFGRDAEILQGLDALRGMRADGGAALFVILAASGAGKSSYLRAGLLPRLARDDRHFHPLDVVRPENSPLFGERGLAQSLFRTCAQLFPAPGTLGGIKAALKEGAERLTALLHDIQDAAQKRLVGLPDPALPPTLVLPVDQAEELFSADATAEARTFLALIGAVVRGASTAGRGVPLIVAFTIRSDRYESLQNAAELAGLKTIVFDALRPMHPVQFKEVITGPARRATAAGRRLEIAPDMVDRLLADCAGGADTLPLLSLALARLHRDYGSDGRLTLAEYRHMGGLADIIQSEAEAIFAADPGKRQVQLELLHAAFVPWLATINPDSDEPMRRVERLSNLPDESRPLIRALVDRRLLLVDVREGQQVVEVAHESLLRQWRKLAAWLGEERDNLKHADRLERESVAWRQSGGKADWLLEGERLALARALAEEPAYRHRLLPVREFLLASQHRDMQRRDEETRLRRAEVVAAQDRQAAAETLAAEQTRAAARAQADARRLARRGWLLAGLLCVAIAVASLAGWYGLKAQREFRRATALRVNADGQAMLDGARPDGLALGLLQLLAAYRIAPQVEIESAMMKEMVALARVERLIDTTTAVHAVAFSRDGTRIVSGGDDGIPRLWDAKTGAPIGAPQAIERDSAVYGVAFTRDGRQVVSTHGGRIRLWDAATGAPAGESRWAHLRAIEGLAVSPDGTRVVSGSADHTLRLWDATNGEQVGPVWEGPGGDVLSVAFSPDGTRIVSGSADRTLLLWDAHDGTRIGEPLTGHEGAVSSVAFSPDGKRIVSGSADGTLRLWRTEDGTAIGDPLVGHQAEVTSVAFSPDGTRVVSGSRDGTLRLWNAANREAIGPPLPGHRAAVSCVAFSPDGTRIVSGGYDRTLRFWDAKAEATLEAAHFVARGSVSDVAFGPNGTRLFTSGSDLRPMAWNAGDGAPAGPVFEPSDRELTRIAVSPDGKRIAAADDGGTLRLWNADSGATIGVPLPGHEGQMTGLAFSPDGARIVSGGDDSTLRLWDAATGQPIGLPRKSEQDRILSAAFSPDGARIVSGGGDGTLRVWDAKDLSPRGAPVRGHDGLVASVAFSPDGRRIVSGGSDRTLRLWDAGNGAPIGAPLQASEALAGFVTSVAFSADGTYIVSGSNDKTLRVWDAESGAPIGPPLRGHLGKVTRVAFSPDDLQIVSGGADSSWRLWPAPKAWPDRLCAKLTRNMSRAEWNRRISPGIPYIEQCPGLPVPAEPTVAVSR